MGSDLEPLAQWAEVRTDAEELATYGRDWTRVFEPAPRAVLFPRDSEGVARCLAYCHQESLPVVPSGGRTGLAGGAVAARGEIVLSLDRLDWLRPVDRLGLTLEVGAGVRTQAVHEHCAPLGLTWPIDLAAKGSSQVGGNLATNAGGIRVIRYGHARNWVTGLVVALMDGTLLELGGALQKNNTGPDLRQLFIGSEGTLGVITEATLKLTQMPSESQVLLFAVGGVERGLELLSHARLEGALELLAFEYLTANCMEAVLQVTGRKFPLSARAPAYVLLECLGARTQRLESWLETVLQQGLVEDGVLAASSEERSALWAFRENITESLGHLGRMHKNDVSVAVHRLPEFVGGLQDTLRYPGEVYLFGHLGDGNLHVNVMKPQAMAAEEFYALCHPADHALYALLRDLGGSVAAEHGIGLLKKSALAYSRSSAEIELMRRLKAQLDPRQLLNPGKILPD